MLEKNMSAYIWVSIEIALQLTDHAMRYNGKNMLDKEMRFQETNSIFLYRSKNVVQLFEHFAQKHYA